MSNGGAGPRVRNQAIRRVRVADIVDNPHNYRTHDDAQREGLATTVAEIGWYGYPDVFEHPDHPGRLMLIDGELRTHHLLERYGADATIEVNVTDFSPAEAAKALATHDPLSAMAGLNADKHAALMRELSGVEASGRFRQFLDDLAERQAADAARFLESQQGGGAGGGSRGQCDPDETPEVQSQAFTLPGDVWLLDGHRILCGNSRSREDVARLLADARVDLVVTSPPYNCDIEYDEHDDAMPVDEYLAFIGDVVGACVAHLANGRYVSWNVGVTPKSMHFDHARLLGAAGLTFRRQIVWAKAGVAFPIWQYTDAARKYHPNYTHEVIYLFSHGEPEVGGDCDIDDAYSRDVWSIHQSAASRDLPGTTNGRRPRTDAHGGSKAAAHPAAYPVGIPAGSIKHLTARGELVYDPFLGSGTTMVASHALGRRCVGMELSPQYCDLAVRRVQRFTGCQLVLERDGGRYDVSVEHLTQHQEQA